MIVRMSVILKWNVVKSSWQVQVSIKLNVSRLLSVDGIKIWSLALKLKFQVVNLFVCFVPVVYCSPGRNCVTDPLIND